MYITHRHRQQCGDSQREGGGELGEGEGSQGGKNGDEKRLSLG